MADLVKFFNKKLVIRLLTETNISQKSLDNLDILAQNIELHKLPDRHLLWISDFIIYDLCGLHKKTALSLAARMNCAIARYK